MGLKYLSSLKYTCQDSRNLVTLVELGYFLRRLGVCIRGSHSAYKVSFASATSTCNLPSWTLSISDSVSSADTFERLCVLDGLPAVVHCLS